MTITLSRIKQKMKAFGKIYWITLPPYLILYFFVYFSGLDFREDWGIVGTLLLIVLVVSFLGVLVSVIGLVILWSMKQYIEPQVKILKVLSVGEDKYGPDIVKDAKVSRVTAYVFLPHMEYRGFIKGVSEDPKDGTSIPKRKYRLNQSGSHYRTVVGNIISFYSSETGKYLISI